MNPSVMLVHSAVLAHLAWLTRRRIMHVHRRHSDRTEDRGTARSAPIATDEDARSSAPGITGSSTRTRTSHRGWFSQNSCRRGIAATEFAITLPMVMMLLLGSIEVANFIHLKQAITVAAYETALAATGTGATGTAATTRGNAVLSAFGVSGATLTISPTVTSSTASGTDVVVTISVPTDSNAISPPWFLGGKTLTATITMVRL